MQFLFWLLIRGIGRERESYLTTRAKCPSLIILKFQDLASWLAQAWKKHRVKLDIYSSIREQNNDCLPDILGSNTSASSLLEQKKNLKYKQVPI